MMLRRREYKHKLCEAGIVEECNITVDPDKFEEQIPKLIEKIQNERADMRLASLKAMNNISIILFANRLSGSGLGQQVISSILPRSDVHVVCLPEEPYSWKELGYDQLHNPDLRIAVCGGVESVSAH